MADNTSPLVGQNESRALTIYECPECGSLDAERSRCERLPDHDRRRAAVTVYREAQVERAWRNGWGSALNCLRAADKIVRDAQAPRMAIGDRATQRIFHRMVDQWIALINGLVEDVIAKGRETGLAETQDSVPAGQKDQPR